MISIIIRTKNEERWIRLCLERVIAQDIYLPFEIVIVDNCSEDKTIDRALTVYPSFKLVEINNFLPGFALNEGIRVSSGDYIVCLSAHCPPVNKKWLSMLLKNIEQPNIAGVYGRQLPTRFTNSIDKRDLLVTFGLDRRIQVRDPFFHNANSMIKRDVWQQHPFDEEVTNIEDRLWGQQVIKDGYKIVYEPEAEVFHYHGIYQKNRTDRARNVVHIMENYLSETHSDFWGTPFDPTNMEVAVLIPLRATGASIDFSEDLIKLTVDSAKKAKYINRILVTTENKALANIAQSFGIEVPFLRPSELAVENIRADEALRHFLIQLEKDGYLPDIVVPMEITYPFRPPGIIDGVIEYLLREGVDTAIAGISEYRPCWKVNGDKYNLLTDIDQPRSQREPIHIGIPSLACATYPSNLRKGSRLSGKVSIFEINDPLASIEIRDTKQLQSLENKMNWKGKNK